MKNIITQNIFTIVLVVAFLILALYQLHEERNINGVSNTASKNLTKLPAPADSLQIIAVIN